MDRCFFNGHQRSKSVDKWSSGSKVEIVFSPELSPAKAQEVSSGSVSVVITRAWISAVDVVDLALFWIEKRTDTIPYGLVKFSLYYFLRLRYFLMGMSYATIARYATPINKLTPATIINDSSPVVGLWLV